MIKRVFHDHPASVGESYGEHFRTASGYGVAMILGGIGCLIHAAVPALFVTAGSRTIGRLHARLVRGRAAEAEMRAGGWVI